MMERYSAHGMGDSRYTHIESKARFSVLGVAVFLTLGFSLVELVGGYFANSLALIGDAGHMVTDSLSLLFALIANRIAQKGADSDHSFGHGRVEVLAAFVNGLFLLGVVIWLFSEAFARISTPEAVSGESVMLIATVGLVINLLVAWRLSQDQKNLNTRAALVHVLGDLLGSIAAIVAGGVIWAGGPAIVDPILSMLVGVLLLRATWHLLKESALILLDGVPDDVNYFSVGRTIESIPGVERVHDLHIWTMSPGHGALQCHVKISSYECWPRILDAIRVTIDKQFGISHVTVQPEWTFDGDNASCEVCQTGLCQMEYDAENQIASPQLDETVLSS